jgi:hypothetical protein
MGDFEFGLTGVEHDEPLIVAVPDSNRGIRVQMHYRIIRQTMSLLLAVACLEVKRRNGGRRRDVRDGSEVPQQE